MKKKKVLDYLKGLSESRYVIAGQHNQESKNGRPYDPALSTKNIAQITRGQYPGLWSGDFLYQSGYTDHKTRMEMIHEAVRQWNRGALVNIMWHACPPTQKEPCQWQDGVLSRLSDKQWQELIRNDKPTPLNKNWEQRLDKIAWYLEYLNKKGVVVLWRPFHEMNQGKFWWGGRPGANGTQKLYRRTYDYLVDRKGLTNLIWIWNLQDVESLGEHYKRSLIQDLKDYNPGDRYWDIASLDIYQLKRGFTSKKYKDMLKLPGKKPIAIGECFSLPTARILNEQPHWVFFMGWGEEVHTKYNKEEKIKNLYDSPNVLNRSKVKQHLAKFGL